MSLTDRLQNVTHLFLDTAPVIYYIEENSRYWAVLDPFFDLIYDGSLIAVTSPVTLAECLVHPYIEAQTQLQQQFTNLIVRTNNITFMPIDQNMAQHAGQLRAKYNIELPDAFQVAVALAAECEALLTNDRRLGRVTELQVLVLDELQAG